MAEEVLGYSCVIHQQVDVTLLGTNNRNNRKQTIALGDITLDRNDLVVFLSLTVGTSFTGKSRPLRCFL